MVHTYAFLARKYLKVANIARSAKDTLGSPGRNPAQKQGFSRLGHRSVQTPISPQKSLGEKGQDRILSLCHNSKPLPNT